MEPKANPPRCRECGRRLDKIPPRGVVTITREATLPPRTHVRAILGRYCSADCALDALQRGIPRHH